MKPIPTKAAGNPAEPAVEKSAPKLRDLFHEAARVRHLAERTEQAYWDWVLRYLKFHRDLAGGWRHPREIGRQGVNPFLTHLATENHKGVSPRFNFPVGLIHRSRRVKGGLVL